MISREKIPSRLPFSKEDIYLIVEGEVDEIFLDRIFSFFDKKYNVRIRVAGGNGNIPIHVNILKKIYSFSKIFVLYDLDANFTIKDIKKLLKNKEAIVKEDEIFFVNPCIEHLVVLCKFFENKKLKTKKDYQPLISKYYDLNYYGGHVPEMEKIVNKIFAEDYNRLMFNLSKTSTNDSDLPSSNFGYLVEKIKSKQ